MSKKQTLLQLQGRLRSVYWQLQCTMVDWERQLLKNELRYITSSIQFLQSDVSKMS